MLVKQAEEGADCEEKDMKTFDLAVSIMLPNLGEEDRAKMVSLLCATVDYAYGIMMNDILPPAYSGEPAEIINLKDWKK